MRKKEGVMATERKSGDQSPARAATPAASATGLAALMAAAGSGALPPVDMWNPPHCGDIGMEIRADGTWFYQNSPIGRVAMVKLFSRIVRGEPDGSFVLVTPVEKVVLKVADAPFLAVELEASGEGRDQRLIFRTNVDDLVECDAAHPLTCKTGAADGLKPYVRVRGRLDALMTRAVYYQLVEHGVEEQRAGRTVFGVWSGAEFWPLEAQH